MFLGVVEPVSGASSADEFVVVGDLEPHDFVDPSLAPLGETLPRQFHCTSSDPEEDEPVVAQFLKL